MAPRRRNPKGAGVLRAIAALLLLDGPHRERLRRRALRSHHNTHARDPLYFHHGLLAGKKDTGCSRVEFDRDVKLRAVQVI